MGKVANAKRKKFFEELDKQDTVTARKAKLKLKPAKTEVNETTIAKKSLCCLLKHKNNLPMGFRKCINCPR